MGPARRAARFIAALLLMLQPALLPRTYEGLRGAPGQAVRQVLILDAGSSGTRIHVFNLLDVPSGEHVPKVELVARQKSCPGLSRFASDNDLDGARASIRSLMAFADAKVPVQARRQPPVLFKATAGLRSVSDTRRRAVLEQVRTVLRAG